MSRKKPAPPRRTVRPCTAEHLPAIREIYNDAILNSTALYEYAPRSEETMREWFAARQRDGIPVLGIEWEPGVLAGFVTWGPFRPRPAYKYSVEHSVYVDERFRGHGIGRQLLEAIVAATARTLETRRAREPEAVLEARALGREARRGGLRCVQRAPCRAWGFRARARCSLAR